MARYIEGETRLQRLLLPDCLEDYVSEDNPVRVVDVFIDELDLGTMGFAGPASTGRPGYHPATLLKLYLYGYLNQVQSSRRLEREAGRNVEVMWLTGKLAPDFKTIADFRRDNGAAIRAACAQFVVLCRQLGLLAGGTVAVDGSRFKAVNTRDKNFTPGAIRRRMEQVEASIARYLSLLDTADRQEDDVAQMRSIRLKDRLDRLRQQMRDLQAMDHVVAVAPDRQVSLTDPDARAMATNGKGTGLVGYNVQAAVDAKHHLIVAHEVTNIGHDRSQLASMGRQAKDATGAGALTVLADRGYFSGEEVLACDEIGISAIVPKPLTSGAKADGRWGKQDFTYDAPSDTYRCPAGETLTWRFSSVEKDLTLHTYWADGCGACLVKDQCTTGKQRRIKRWEHEVVIEAMQRRLDRMPDAMRIRRRTVEHVFGTIKDWMGRSHFLTRHLPNVGTEMSLHVLAYNLKRAIAILGAATLMKAMRA
ncbi:IS1182 family transposase [Bosea sp. BIWAKO-01]|uniref:IS1182 family transposase n=1 Tax=Bosea sp. BIWAKO-01 TaxID=506668 RepID=UPI000852CA0B|nr:IS1182 family transposase [Bosea sp. BIWAKO-01]GAU83381.1 mobile element protein [Bosea sp. BIWAKO-01]GAU84158.1 mobile element protein [Bosea sp. BIWAKO-01]GAU84177.1 mobile element protein [Bosea sp. BIWAKO-01]GAU84189.1 mobile element protein [Bosea sp. BIWAKO-01]GAU85919.1 mobile element protein [Bosea sp. BIWAKO-01]